MKAAQLPEYIIRPPKPTGPGPYTQKQTKIYSAHGSCGWIIAPFDPRAARKLAGRPGYDIRVTTFYYWA